MRIKKMPLRPSEQSAYQKIGFTPEQVAANFKTLNTVSGATAKSQQAAGLSGR